MSTVDSLLLQLYRNGVGVLVDNNVAYLAMDPKDRRILVSLAKQLIYGNFLTKNQGALLLKILRENEHLLSPYIDYSNLVEPTWTQDFRVIEQVKKIYISKDINGVKRLTVEFTYNKTYSELISKISSKCEMFRTDGRQYTADLTENNVKTIMDTFKKHNFVVDPEIADYYEQICEFHRSKDHPFDVFKNERIAEAVKAELGNLDSLLHLHDRKLRYQYVVTDKTPIDGSDVCTRIAMRDDRRVWVNSGSTKLSELMLALKHLDRLPLLVVFDGHDSKAGLENLLELKSAIESVNITDVGIHFRFDNNTPSNKTFNETVGSLAYNKKVEDGTSVVGISSTKLPKFMLKTNWYPKSVITVTPSFRGNKTFVYCDAVDLIIHYGKSAPLNWT